MLNVNIICVGNLREKYLKDGCAEFTKRLSRFCKLTVIEVPEYKLSKSASLKEQQNGISEEGVKILSKIPEGSAVYPLCIEGKLLSSEKLANTISEASLKTSRLTFIIGGSNGLSPEVKEKGIGISISPMTFTHQMARLILLEQIYRGFKILGGESYHK